MQTPIAWLWARIAFRLSAEEFAEWKREFHQYQNRYQAWCVYRREKKLLRVYQLQGRNSIEVARLSERIADYERSHPDEAPH